jgi:cGMP-dependent protein kinase
MGCASSTPAKEDDDSEARTNNQSSQPPPVLKEQRIDAPTPVASPEKPVATVQVEPPKIRAEPAKPKTSPNGAHVPVRPSTTSPQQSKSGVPIETVVDKAKSKERRAAAGSEAVRDQIRKLVVGGPQTKEEKANVYEVSDSEEEDLIEEDSPKVATSEKSNQEKEAICEGLKKNFVFKGIPDNLLLEVVNLMYGVAYQAGSTVLQQGDRPKKDDCMYFLHSGEAEVVISGAVDDANKIREGGTVEGNTVRILQKPALSQ